MVDLHSHILPGIDDGAKNVEESIKIAKLAVEDGITRMIATPHYDFEDRDFSKRVLFETDELNNILKKENVPLTIYPGTEVLLNGTVLRELEEGKILTLNRSKYLLVEFHLDHLPHRTNELLYEVRLLGYTPVIAHPERYREVQRNINLVKEWVEQGNRIQMNATSIVGVNGDAPRDAAKHLLKHHMVHLMGSDTHSPRNRKPRMTDAMKIVKQWVEEDIAEELLGNNGKVFRDERIDEKIPIPYPEAYNYFKRVKEKFNL